MADIKSVLFVCTGNSCRSVMAAGLLKKELASLGKSGIEVRSAGIRALDGFPPTDETIKVMKDEGVDVSGHKSKALSAELIKSFDLILVMEEMHKNDITRRFPEAAGRTFLLKNYKNEKDPGGTEDLEISDPIGMSIDYYKNCFNEVKGQIERIARIL